MVVPVYLGLEEEGKLGHNFHVGKLGVCPEDGLHEVEDFGWAEVAGEVSEDWEEDGIAVEVEVA